AIEIAILAPAEIANCEADPAPSMMMLDAVLRKSRLTDEAILYTPGGTFNVPPPAFARALRAPWRAGPSSVLPFPVAPKFLRFNPPSGDAVAADALWRSVLVKVATPPATAALRKNRRRSSALPT